MLEPEHLVESLRAMSSGELHDMAEAVRQVQIERAVTAGDHDSIVTRAFETGFGRDGLGVQPWVEGEVIVCPGALISKSRTSHRCRFVSVDDVWVWDSGLLMREDKRSSPGVDDGFRAIALVPVVDGIVLDVVSGRARSGGHSGLADGCVRRSWSTERPPGSRAAMGSGGAAPSETRSSTSCRTRCGRGTWSRSPSATSPPGTCADDGRA